MRIKEPSLKYQLIPIHPQDCCQLLCAWCGEVHGEPARGGIGAPHCELHRQRQDWGGPTEHADPWQQDDEAARVDEALPSGRRESEHVAGEPVRNGGRPWWCWGEGGSPHRARHPDPPSKNSQTAWGPRCNHTRRGQLQMSITINLKTDLFIISIKITVFINTSLKIVIRCEVGGAQ